jgi:Beta-lactamase
VALGLLQDSRVVFADGFGAKELGGRDKPDSDTLFMVASNTKALTTALPRKYASSLVGCRGGDNGHLDSEAL